MGIRGEEMVKLGLYNFKLHCEDAMHDKHLFLPIPLLGRFKGETGTRNHILPIALATRSRINNGVWIVFILTERREASRQRSWLFDTDEDKRMKASEMEYDMFKVLERLQEDTCHIPGSSDVKEELAFIDL